MWREDRTKPKGAAAISPTSVAARWRFKPTPKEPRWLRRRGGRFGSSLRWQHGFEVGRSIKLRMLLPPPPHPLTLVSPGFCISIGATVFLLVHLKRKRNADKKLQKKKQAHNLLCRGNDGFIYYFFGLFFSSIIWLSGEIKARRLLCAVKARLPSQRDIITIVIKKLHAADLIPETSEKLV